MAFLELALAALSPLTAQLTQNNDQQQTQFAPFQPTDIFGSNVSQLQLGQEGQQEKLLAGLQQGLFQGGADALQGGLPPELSLGNLSKGELPKASQERIQKLAFSGIDRGLRKASAIASESALARGVPLSSLQGVQEAALQQPLIEQAQDRAEALSLSELNRLEGLRQNFLSNSLALQNSPALQRLTQLRLAQGKQTQENLQLTREPGELPGQFGPEDQRTSQQKIDDLNQELYALNTQLIAQGIPKHKRNKIINDKRRELASKLGFAVGDNFNVFDPSAG